MKEQEFTERILKIKLKLFKTAMTYFQNETIAIDVVDEAVYRGLKNCRKLRQEEFFDTWMTRIVLNECHKEYKRHQKHIPLEDYDAIAPEEFDGLALKDAVNRLPIDLKEVIILRYFSQYTLVETAGILDLPQGTVATRERKALKLLRLEFLDKEENNE